MLKMAQTDISSLFWMDRLNTIWDQFNKPQSSTEVRGQVDSISTMTTVQHETQPYLVICLQKS